MNIARQSQEDIQGFVRYLSARLLQEPELHKALEQSAAKDSYPKCQIYISRPDLFDDPFFTGYRVGAKVTYIDENGLQEQFGQMARIGSIQNKTLLEHLVAVLAKSLADSILEHEELKKPLPIQQLTAKDREEMQWPF